MHSFFGVSLSSAGLISMLISGGTILSSLASDRITKALKPQYVTLISVFLTAAALLGFSFARRYWQLCLLAIPYGLGAGCIDAALNNYVALHYNSRQMSWLHCFWGVGTIVSPYVMSLAIAGGAWQGGYRSVAGIQFAIALILALSLPLWRVHSAPRSAGSAQRQGGGLLDALRTPGVPQILIGFFGYCAAESTCMLWSASYLISVRQFTPERAAAFASLFFIGLTAGRFLSGFISDRVGDRGMIRLGLAVGLAGAALSLIPGLPEPVVLAGLVVMGLGCAPVYPSIIHATPTAFGPEKSQAIIGIQMASAYVGSTFMPPLFGLLSRAGGQGWMPVFFGVFLLLCLVMTGRSFRMTSQKQTIA